MNCPKTKLLSRFNSNFLKTGPSFFWIFFLLSQWCVAQTVVKIQTGYGYLEHFSFGPVLEWKKKNTVSIHYGSDFFYRTKDFSTFFLKFNRSISSPTDRRMTNGMGAKIGHTIFTDTYYRWKIVSLVPFIGCRYRINKHLAIGTDAGLAISRIESVTRVSYGDIGKYKRYLPELNISLYRAITKSNGD